MSFRCGLGSDTLVATSGGGWDHADVAPLRAVNSTTFFK